MLENKPTRNMASSNKASNAAATEAKAAKQAKEAKQAQACKRNQASKGLHGMAYLLAAGLSGDVSSLAVERFPVRPKRLEIAGWPSLLEDFVRHWRAERFRPMRLEIAGWQRRQSLLEKVVRHWRRRGFRFARCSLELAGWQKLQSLLEDVVRLWRCECVPSFLP